MERRSVLCVVDAPPIPASGGGVIRVKHLLQALIPVGELTLLVLHEVPESRRRVISEALGGAHVASGSVTGRLSAASAARAVARDRDVPFHLSRRDFRPTRRAFTALGPKRFDMTFFSSPLAWQSLRELAPRPHVINLNDLPSRLHRRMLRRRAERLLHPAKNGVSGLPEWAGDAKHFAVDAVDTWRWPRFESAMTRTADLIVIPSESEALALGSTTVFVPNGAREPDQGTDNGCASGGNHVASHPAVVFPANFHYEPNRDGAHFLVEEVLPLLRRAVPRVKVVLAGAGSEELEPLASMPEVETTGFLPDFEVAWRRADLVVVPLMVGSGTRLKILEAWARSLPVVSTTIGAEGLGAIDGTHLVLADSPDQFAMECSTLLQDPDRAATIGAAGHRLFEERFRWDSIEAQFRTLVEEVMSC